MTHQFAGSTEEPSQTSKPIAQSTKTVASLSQQDEGGVGHLASATGSWLGWLRIFRHH